MSIETGALVLFSAGQDSATCLAWALARYARVETIGFDYGQRHGVEMTQRPIVLAQMAAMSGRWAARLGPDHVVDLRGFGQTSPSALTRDFAIQSPPEGPPNTFVPGRNLVFLSVAAAHAYGRGLADLVGGMCETDYSGYADCRRTTMDAMETALNLGIGAPIRIETPLMQLTKGQTWQLAHSLGGDDLVEMIRTQTHTCYEGDRTQLHPSGFGCGRCPACVLRAAGWEAFNASSNEG